MKKTILLAHRITSETINNKNKLKELFCRLIRETEIKGVEFDIRQTRDEKFIAFHDSKFPQLQKYIKDYTFEQLKKEAAKEGFSFLTMEETIKEIPENFEIQIDIKDKMITIEKFLEIISNFNIIGNLIVSSFYPKLLYSLSFSNIKKRWLLTNHSLKRNPAHIFYALMPVKIALSCKATGISPYFSLINKNVINKAHQNNLTVASWGINSEKETKNLLKYNIDYLIISPSLILKNPLANYLKSGR